MCSRTTVCHGCIAVEHWPAFHIVHPRLVYGVARAVAGRACVLVNVRGEDNSSEGWVLSCCTTWMCHFLVWPTFSNDTGYSCCTRKTMLERFKLSFDRQMASKSSRFFLGNRPLFPVEEQRQPCLLCGRQPIHRPSVPTVEWSGSVTLTVSSVGRDAAFPCVWSGTCVHLSGAP